MLEHRKTESTLF